MNTTHDIRDPLAAPLIVPRTPLEEEETRKLLRLILERLTFSPSRSYGERMRSIEMLEQHIQEHTKGVLQPQSGDEPIGFDYEAICELIQTTVEAVGLNDSLVKKLESMMVFIAQIARSHGWVDVLLSLTNFIQILHPRSMSSFMKEHIIDRFRDLFQVDFTEQSTGIDLEKLDFGATAFRSGFDFLAGLKDLPIMQKLHKFLLYCVSHSLLDSLGITFDALNYSKFEAEAVKKAHSSNAGFLFCLMDALSLFCKQFVQSVRLGNFEPFYHSGDTYVKWTTLVLDLKRKEKFLSNPEPHGFDIFSFRSDLDEALEQGSVILAASRQADKFTKERLKQYVLDLQMMKSNDISRRSAQRDRPCPFGVMYFGGSSLGKSTLINITFQYYAKIFSLSNDSCGKYTRNPGEKYWNGFSTSQWCIVLDDIAAQNPSLGVEDPSLKEIIGVMNNVAYQPDQASLEDKGKTPVQAKLVIATTNTEHLNAHAYFSVPLAVQRRLPWVVEVEVKDEHAYNRMLDHSTCSKEEGKYADYWKFTVKRVIPASDSPSNKRGKTQVVHRFTSITDYLAWFGKEAKKHDSIQNMVIAEEKDTSNIEVCMRCLFPQYVCTCDDVIVLEEDTRKRDARMAGLHQYRRDVREKPLRSGEVVKSCWGCGNAFLSCVCVDGKPDYAVPYFLTAPCTVCGSEGLLSCSCDEYNPHECIQCACTPCACSFETQSMSFSNSTAIETFSPTFLGVAHCIKYLGSFIWAYITGVLSRYSYIDLSWNEYDSESAMYTLGVFAWTTMMYTLWYLVGTLFFWIFGSAFIVGLRETDWQDRLFRFLVRRLGSRVRVQYSQFVSYAKVFAVLSTGLYVAGVFTKHVTLKAFPKEIVLTCEECHEKKARAGLIVQSGSTERMPEVTTAQRENVWYKEVFNTTKFDISKGTSSWKGLPSEQVRAAVLKNCMRVTIHKPGKLVTTGALALGGQLYAINAHSIPQSPAFVLSIEMTKDEGVTTNHSCIITTNQIYLSKTSDVAFVVIKTLPPRKDISFLFPEESFNGRYNGELIGVSPDLEVYSNKVFNVTQMPGVNPEYKYFGGISDKLTKVGDCGSALLVFSPLGPVILGIHSLGSVHKEVRAARIFRTEIAEARNLLNTPCIESGEPELNSESAPLREIIPLDKKSPVRFIEQGSANVYGSLSGPRFQPKSKVIRTCIADDIESLGFSQKFDKPILKGYRPWRHAALALVDIPSTFRSDILDHCVDCFSNDILSLLEPEDLNQVHVYDMFTAINGRAGLAYVDKMNRNTSAGFPWCKTKRAYLFEIEPMHDLSDPMDIDDEIKIRVQAIINTYKSGKRWMPIFMANLKDEPTKFKKIETGKTRVFGGAPFDWSIVVRMYLLSLIRLIQDNRYVFESAPGTVAQSEEWHDMREYLTSLGDRMAAGDHENFDKKMSPLFTLGGFEVLTRVAKAAGYTEEDILVIQGIAMDTAFPLFNFNGDLIEFFGSNPSGHPLTVILNGLANCLYNRYCFTVSNPEHTCVNFKRMVRLMTYGDDDAKGVSVDAPWFNHSSMQTVLAEHGLKYTMADKDSATREYIPMDEVTFLKRSWRFDSDVGHYLCPLEEQSIEKSLITCVASTSISQEHQALEIMSTACSEYWFYGRAKFEDMRLKLIKISERDDLAPLVREGMFPTWDDLYDRYKGHGLPKSWHQSLKHFA